MSSLVIETLEARIAPATLTLSGPVEVAEGNFAANTLSYEILLSEPAPASGVQVDFATMNGSAVLGADYVPEGLTVSFAEGQTSQVVKVLVKGDTAIEPDETFSVLLSNPVGATLGNDSVTTTILNDDVVPNPLPNIIAAPGQTGAQVDLGGLFDPQWTAEGGGRTFVEFTTNFINPNQPGVPQKLVLELYNDLTPLTVQNFLSYVTSTNAAGDYNGVFFHRLMPGFVLQGGGFEASTPAEHIPVGPLLHNEFASAWAGYDLDPNDDLRANVRGTIAMAKTGLGPNTATSEFFFNLADNSANLDFQNGGFTVFGKLTDESLAVVDAMAALTVKDLSSVTKNGALTNVPVQGSTSGTIAPGQLLQITGARILEPYNGTSPDHQFSVVSVTDSASGAASTLVNANLAGDTLDLTFKPGASGVAKIKVLATPLDGSEPIEQEFSVTIKPDLTVTTVGTTLGGVLLPGDTGLAKVKILNSGATLAKGKVDVKFYLSYADGFSNQGAPLGPDPYGLQLDSRDLQVGAVNGKLINLDSGDSKGLVAKIKIPKTAQELLTLQGDYRLIAVVSPSESSTVSELFTDNNTNLDATTHQRFNVFGSFNDGKSVRQNVPFTFLDGDGQKVTFKLNDGGYGLLFPDASGAVDVQVTGSSVSSILSAKTAKGADNYEVRNIAIGTAQAAAPIGTVSLGDVDLSGRFLAYGGLKNLTLGDVKTGAGTGHYIGIGTSESLASAKATVRLGSMTDTAFESLLPIKSLSATQWLDSTVSREQISTPALGSFTVTGNLAADLFVTGESTVKKFTVGGAMDDAKVRILGSVGKVSLGSMLDSSFFVGDDGNENTLETSVIGSFSIKGTDAIPGVLSNSTIIASQFGSIYVQSVDPNSGTEPFGFLSRAIKSYQRGSYEIANIIVNNTGGADANVYDAQGNYSVRLL